MQISLKDGASPEELEKAKQTVKDQGGSIKHEFTLIKGFTYVASRYLLAIACLLERGDSAEFPADKITTLEKNPHLDVEQDKEVHIS